LEEGVSFFEAIDVEFDGCGVEVPDCEVKPLAVPIGVGIDSHVEIVFCFSHPNY
jgi:hypothetical protein